jgi:hypothetical protein
MHFAKKDMLQKIDLARFLIAEAIPLRRKARRGARDGASGYYSADGERERA